MNSVYKGLFVERVRYALAAARAAQPLEHAGVKGAVREVLIADLFRPLLPADIGIASGVLISAFDEGQSSQQDIIIFDKSIIPPILFDQGPAVVPVESALVCVEVKSKLNASEMRTAHDGAKSVRDLYGHAGTRDPATDKWVPQRMPAVSSFVFALDTDLVPDGQSEPERYNSLVGVQHTWISGICVAGRAAWFSAEKLIYDKDSGLLFKEDHSPISGEWHETLADAEHAEVLAMLTGVIDLAQRIGSFRGQPPLSAYLTPTQEEAKRKIRITSGPQAGFYVGLDKTGSNPQLWLHGVPYSFYAEVGAAFEFRPDKAAEMQRQIESMTLGCELI